MAIAPFTWEGDNARAIEWLPFAESALMALAACANGVMMQQCHQPESDVLIMLQVNPHSIFIRAINTAYMESGFLDWDLLMLSAAPTYTPSTIIFNRRVAMLTRNRVHNPKGPYINASEQREVWMGDESWALGCEVKSSQITTYDFYGTPYTFVSSGKAPKYCEPGRLYARKYAQATVPPSTFSGPMRQYIQSLYGTKDIEYGGGQSIAGPYITISTGEFELNPDGTPKFKSSGERVLTSITMYPYALSGDTLTPIGGTKNEWAYIKIDSQGKITARPMKQKGRPVMQNVGGDAELAYLFATLVPGNVEYPVGDISDAIKPYGLRTYGWHFNTDGTRAVAAAYTEFSAYGVDPTGVSGTTTAQKCVAIHLYLSVSKAKSGGYSANVLMQVSEPVIFFPLAMSRFYYPDALTMSQLLLSGIGSDASISGDQHNAVMYAYYAPGDFADITYVLGHNTGWEIVPPEIDMSLNSGNPAEVFGISMWGADGPVYTRSGILSTAGGFRSPLGVPRGIAKSKSSAITPGGLPQYPAYRESLGLTQWAEYRIAGHRGVGGFYEDGAPPFDPHPVTYWYYSIGTWESFRRTVTKSSHTTLTVSSAIIPFGDSCAVLFSTYESTGGHVLLNEAGTQGNHILYAIDDIPQSAGMGGMIFGLIEPWEVAAGTATSELDQIIGGDGGWTGWDADGRPVSLDVSLARSLAMDMDNFGHPMERRTSVGGAWVFSSEGAGASDSSEWPEGETILSPVGWA